MVTETKTWGRWILAGSELITFTPNDYRYTIPVIDLKSERMAKVWIGIMASKRWIEVSDLFDLRAAIRDLQSEAR